MALAAFSLRRCWSCQQLEGPQVSLKRCRTCLDHDNPHTAVYCSVKCQRRDWPRHKSQCRSIPNEIVQARDIGQRWCEHWRESAMGDFHYGDLELVADDSDDDDDLDVATFQNAEEQTKLRLLQAHSDRFRWQCCGLRVDQGVLGGCPHHNQSSLASSPCRCTACQLRPQQVSQKVQEEQVQSQSTVLPSHNMSEKDAKAAELVYWSDDDDDE